MVLLDLMIEPVAIRLISGIGNESYPIAKLSNVVFSGFINELDSDFQSFKFNVKLGFGLLISQVLFLLYNRLIFSNGVFRASFFLFHFNVLSLAYPLAQSFERRIYYYKKWHHYYLPFF